MLLMDQRHQGYFGNLFGLGMKFVWEYGVEPLPIWGQREPQGDWNAIMDRVKGNIVWVESAAQGNWEWIRPP